MKIKTTSVINFFIFFFLISISSSLAYLYNNTEPTQIERPSLNTSDSNITVKYYEETAQGEFIIDAPLRIEPGKQIPLFFEVRDRYGSSLWEYSFYGVEIYDENNNKNKTTISCVDMGLPIDGYTSGIPYCTVKTKTWSTLKHLDRSLFIPGQDQNINITAIYDGWGGLWDGDAPPDNKPYLLIHLESKAFPKFDGWSCGDTHFHSSYTDTKFFFSVYGEFGSPINATMEVMRSMGLDWVTITDHSNSFSSHKDDELSWENFKEECSRYAYCLVGTEINCNYNYVGGGNHLLGYNYSEYIEDNFTDFLSPNNPTCREVISNILSQNGFTYAAHPESKIDGALGINTTSRWKNYSLPLNGLEIWNGDIKDSEDGHDVDLIPDGENRIEELEDGLINWTNLLLESRRIFISAGSDAHGDLNDKFGREMTCVYVPSYHKENIFTGLKKGNSYITNNGALKFEINNKKLGEETSQTYNSLVTLNIDYNIINSCRINVYRGVLGNTEQLINSQLKPSGSSSSYSYTDSKIFQKNK